MTGLSCKSPLQPRAAWAESRCPDAAWRPPTAVWDGSCSGPLPLRAVPCEQARVLVIREQAHGPAPARSRLAAITLVVAGLLDMLGGELGGARTPQLDAGCQYWMLDDGGM